MTGKEIVRSLRKPDVHDVLAGESLNVVSFARRPSCQNQPKAFEMSRKTKRVSSCSPNAADQERETKGGESPVERR